VDGAVRAGDLDGDRSSLPTTGIGGQAGPGRAHCTRGSTTVCRAPCRPATACRASCALSASAQWTGAGREKRQADAAKNLTQAESTCRDWKVPREFDSRHEPVTDVSR
jgi:hypothetical protein